MPRPRYAPDARIFPLGLAGNVAVGLAIILAAFMLSQRLFRTVTGRMGSRTVAAGACLLVVAIPVVAYYFVGQNLLSLVTVYTQDDFATPDDQRRFVEKYSPFPLPASANGIRFEWTDWMKWDLRGSFSASREDIAAIKGWVATKPSELSVQQIERDVYLEGRQYWDAEKHRGAFIAIDDKADRVRIILYEK